MKMKTWNIEAMTGYKPKTTFYDDLTIAELFGTEAIKDTYRNVMKYWKDSVEYITEFIMALNWKQFEHYERNETLCNVYCELWKKADEWAMKNLKGEDLKYYIRTTD